MTLVITGDSHTWALHEGLASMSSSERRGLPDVRVCMLFKGSPSVAPFCTRATDHVRFLDPGARAAIASVTGRPHLCAADRVAVFGFSMGLMTTLLLRRDTWRGFIPWSVDVEGAETPLSEAAITAIALEHNAHILEFFSLVAGLGIRCVAISAPPPSPFEEALARGIRPAVVLEVDRIARRAVRRPQRALPGVLGGPLRHGPRHRDHRARVRHRHGAAELPPRGPAGRILFVPRSGQGLLLPWPAHVQPGTVAIPSRSERIRNPVSEAQHPVGSAGGPRGRCPESSPVDCRQAAAWPRVAGPATGSTANVAPNVQ